MSCGYKTSIGCFALVGVRSLMFMLASVSTIQLLPCFTCSTKAQSEKQVCLSSAHFVVLCTEISHSMLAPGGWD